jgi:hypothetical protein
MYITGTVRECGSSPPTTTMVAASVDLLLSLSFYSACAIVVIFILRKLLGTLRHPKTALPPGAKVAIIGAGIAGCSASWSLQRQGFKPIAIEKRPVLGGNAKVHTWSNGVTTGRC